MTLDIKRVNVLYNSLRKDDNGILSYTLSFYRQGKKKTVGVYRPGNYYGYIQTPLSRGFEPGTS